MAVESGAAVALPLFYPLNVKNLSTNVSWCHSIYLRIWLFYSYEYIRKRVKILANLLAGLQLFDCTFKYRQEKSWQIQHHAPKFSDSQVFPVYGTLCLSTYSILIVFHVTDGSADIC